MSSRLAAVVAAEPSRAQAVARGRALADALVERFVLVHRTVRAGPDAPTLEQILADGSLRAAPPTTARERECGIGRALYFFLGCAAYPEGSVAFLASPELLAHAPASYTPFDTGSLGRFTRPRDPAANWNEADKRVFLAAHLGAGCDALAFCAQYIPAHFERVDDYVCRPQHSEPDFPTYQGLVSQSPASPDRRAWSFEVQLHTDLDLSADGLDAIVLGQSDLVADFSDELVEKLVIAEDEGSITSALQQHIVREA